MIATIEVDTVFIAADLVAGHPEFEDWGLLIFQIGPRFHPNAPASAFQCKN